MDPNVVVWVGILIALLQITLTRILNYYFPDGVTRFSRKPKDDAEEKEET